MRTIYHVPIVHSFEELDELAANCLKESFGKETSNKFNKLIKEYWREIEGWLYTTIGNFNNVIIYQDSFPLMSRRGALRYFTAVFKECPTCPNYIVIQKLLDKGAVLEGTESIRLLRVFEMMIAEMIKNPHTYEFYERFLFDIAHLRDRFIARRIVATLPEGGRGILFMGINHDVADQLRKISKEIKIISCNG